MRIVLIVLACMLATWAVAQSLPLFNEARFDQVVFGSQAQLDSALPAIPVSILPTWALLLLAVALWSIALILKLVSPENSKELKP